MIVALVDTLRADHLGAYGYSRETSPHIDAFARGNVLFTNTRSQAPCTFPSVNSLLTSRHPSRFHGQDRGRFGIPDELPALPQILRANGYWTAAVSASPIVRKSPTKVNKHGGYEQGFDLFEESCLRQDASCVNERAFELLDARRPFFLYLHYLDPHGPYQPPPSHARRFALAYMGRDFIARGDPNPLARMIYKEHRPPAELPRPDLQHLIDLYDEEILYFDGQFQALLDQLERRGLREHTILVLLSDHGEEFLEHDDLKHCRNLYDTQVRTPLIMQLPGESGGKRLEANAQNLDLVPTLLDYLGLETGEFHFEGRSLRQAIAGEPPGDDLVFTAWRSQRAAVNSRFKLLLNLETQSSELYDLRGDPGETSDLARSHPAEAARLRRALELLLASTEGDRPTSLRVGHDTARQLRALGYLE